MLFASYAATISTNNFKSASKKFEFCTSGFTKTFSRLQNLYFEAFFIAFKLSQEELDA